MIASQDPLILDLPYNFDGPHRFDQDGSYADPTAHLNSTVTIEYAHGIGEVINAAIGARLNIVHMSERTDSLRDFRGDRDGPDPVACTGYAWAVSRYPCFTVSWLNEERNWFWGGRSQPSEAW
jgi:hypothetical protein